MRITPNYNLYKPDYDDAADIDFLNRNADILDEKIKNIELSVGAQAPVRSVNNFTGDIVINSSNTKMDNGNTIQKELTDTTVPSLTLTSPVMINLPNVVDGNIVIDKIEGNTVDIFKEPIVSDFKDKVAGSVVENPNIFKETYALGLSSPISGSFTEISDPKIFFLDGEIRGKGSGNINGSIPQQLFSFNILETIKRKYGITWTVEQAKANISKITCSWWGYGSCPSGNKAYFVRWNTKAKDLSWSFSGGTTSNTPTLQTSSPIVDYLDENGFAHFLAYTDPSDGQTTSMIATDYINIEVQLKPYYKSVDSCVIKSVGKNLFNGIYENKYTPGGYPYDIRDNDPNTKTAFIIIEKGKTYKIKKHTSSNRLILGLYNSINAGSTPVRPLQIEDNTAIEATITNTEGAKYLSVYVSSQNETPQMQIEEGSIATTYEEYKEDKIDILTQLQGDKSLKRLPNGVADTLDYYGVLTRRIGKIVLNGSEEWGINSTSYTDSILFNTKKISGMKSCWGTFHFLSDKFICTDVYSKNVEGFYVDNNNLQIRILKSKLATPDIAGFKKWLFENNVTVYYELAEQIQELITYPGLKSFKNGSITIDSSVPTTIKINYPTYTANRLTNIEQELDRALDSVERCFTFASEGKQLISTAITEKGVQASSKDSFPTLASKISQMQGGTCPPIEDCTEGKKLIADAITRKGVSASGSDDFPILASKIDAIDTSKPTGNYITTMGTMVSDSSSMMPIYFDLGLGFEPSFVVINFFEDIESTVTGGKITLRQPTIIYCKANGIYNNTNEYLGKSRAMAGVGMSGYTELLWLQSPTARNIAAAVVTTGNFVPDKRYRYQVTAFNF